VALCVDQNRPVQDAITGTAVKLKTAQAFVSRFRKAPVAEPAHRGGRRYQKITPEIRRDVIAAVHEDGALTLGALRARVRDAHHVCLSAKSVQRILDGANITLKVARIVSVGRNTPQVIDSRRDYVALMDSGDAPPPNCIVFVDETGFNLWLRRRFARVGAGQRATVAVVNSRGTNVTVVAAMSTVGLLRYSVHRGSFDGVLFTAYLNALCVRLRELHLEHCWVVMDNVRFHHSAQVVAKIKEYGHVPQFLPAYSPILNPIELLFSKWKNGVRRTGFLADHDTLLQRINEAAATITPQDCVGWLHQVSRQYPACREGRPIDTE
jgi:transposase